MLSTLFIIPAAPPWHLLLGHDYTGAPRDAANAAAAKRYDEQVLDHFASNRDRLDRRWSQRFFEDVSLWGGAGFPVFIELGGEGPTNGPPGGLQRQLASVHKAALITLEHRFYGKSWPTTNMSSANLKHLSAEQALADAAQFIQWWSEAYGALGSSWIVWGGSYSGQLASWLRLRYPASVAGAVAYSAPILSQLDFYQYNQVVTSVVASFGGDDCVELLRAAFAQLNASLGEHGAPPGRQGVARLLHACNVTTSDDDDAVLSGSVQGKVQSLVQYNQHGGSSSGWAPTVESFCKVGLDMAANGSSALEALGAMLSSLGEKCLDSNHTLYMEPLRDSNFTTGTPTNRQWYYQLCNEFGQQTCEPGLATDCATGVPGLTPSLFSPLAQKGDLAQGLQLCESLYGIPAGSSLATPPALWSGRQRGWTNVAHGGRAISASSVIFVNGRRDPYSSVSLLPEQVLPEQSRMGVRSVAIENGSHCAGMGAASQSDSSDLAAAKQAVAMAVKEWLGSQPTAARWR